MIKNNLLGQVLIGMLVFFLLVSSVQMFGLGQSIEKVEISQDNTDTLPTMPKAIKTKDKAIQNDQKSMLEIISARPIFSLTREPFKEVGEVAGTGNETNEPISELKVQLTGVVITPENSYAMILDTITNQRDTYKIGMPLEGEQGGWTLDSIESRKVVFVSDDDKTEELELEVYSGSLKAGTASKKGKTKPKDKTVKNNLAEKDDSKKDKKKNADDIRKKIAERRAQMRADAAKKK